MATEVVNIWISTLGWDEEERHALIRLEDAIQVISGAS